MEADAERDFVSYVASRGHLLFRTALALTGHRQQAEDLVQTVLTKSLRHWGRIRRGQPDAYLRTAMYRQYVSWWRRLRPIREVGMDQVADPAVADRTGQVDVRLALAAALRRLPPKQRAVIVLRYLEDLPDDQIADILGCHPSTVRSQAVRALDKLRGHCAALVPLTPQEQCR